MKSGVLAVGSKTKRTATVLYLDNLPGWSTHISWLQETLGVLYCLQDLFHFINRIICVWNNFCDKYREACARVSDACLEITGEDAVDIELMAGTWCNWKISAAAAAGGATEGAASAGDIQQQSVHEQQW